MARARRTEPAAALTYAMRYRRVSTDDGEQDASLDAQGLETATFAATRNWVLAGDFEDQLPGWRVDRPGYQAMLATVRRLRADGKRVVVVVVALDRLGRSVEEGARCREELEALGVEVHYTRQGGVLQPLVADILQAVAKEETRRLGQRVHEQWNYFRGQGWAFIGRIPFGYLLRDATPGELERGATDRVLDVDPIRAPYLQETLRRVAGGEPVRRVREWFASLPEDVRQGRCGNKVSFARMLRNPLFAARDYPQAPDGGDRPDILDVAPEAILVQPRGHWPALVDDATWLAAQRRLRAHRGPDGIPPQSSGAYLLTGFLRCANAACGARMHAQVSRGSPSKPEGQRRYACGGSDLGAHAPDRACHATWPMDALDALVRAELVALLGPLDTTDPAVLADLDRRWERLRHPPVPPGTARARQKAEGRLRAADKQLQVATQKLLRGRISQAAYDVTVPLIEAERAAAERDVARLDAETVRTPDLPPLDAVRATAGGVRAALEAADTAQLREGLTWLLTRVVPEREGRGRYRVADGIAWTPLGEALRALVGASASLEVATEAAG